jgi:hypothetical protein
MSSEQNLNEDAGGGSALNVELDVTPIEKREICPNCRWMLSMFCCSKGKEILTYRRFGRGQVTKQ